jgi:hypothetical protein
MDMAAGHAIDAGVGERDVEGTRNHRGVQSPERRSAPFDTRHRLRAEGKKGFKGKKPQVSFPWASGSG